MSDGDGIDPEEYARRFGRTVEEAGEDLFRANGHSSIMAVCRDTAIVVARLFTAIVALEERVELLENELLRQPEDQA